jgi:hypothetical protein
MGMAGPHFKVAVFVAHKQTPPDFSGGACISSNVA